MSKISPERTVDLFHDAVVWNSDPEYKRSAFDTLERGEDDFVSGIGEAYTLKVITDPTLDDTGFMPWFVASIYQDGADPQKVAQIQARLVEGMCDAQVSDEDVLAAVTSLGDGGYEEHAISVISHSDELAGVYARSAKAIKVSRMVTEQIKIEAELDAKMREWNLTDRSTSFDNDGLPDKIHELQEQIETLIGEDNLDPGECHEKYEHIIDVFAEPGSWNMSTETYSKNYFTAQAKILSAKNEDKTYVLSNELATDLLHTAYANTDEDSEELISDENAKLVSTTLAKMDGDEDLERCADLLSGLIEQLAPDADNPLTTEGYRLFLSAFNDKQQRAFFKKMDADFKVPESDSWFASKKTMRELIFTETRSENPKHHNDDEYKKIQKNSFASMEEDEQTHCLKVLEGEDSPDTAFIAELLNELDEKPRKTHFEALDKTVRDQVFQEASYSFDKDQFGSLSEEAQDTILEKRMSQSEATDPKAKKLYIEKAEALCLLPKTDEGRKRAEGLLEKVKAGIDRGRVIAALPKNAKTLQAHLFHSDLIDDTRRAEILGTAKNCRDDPTYAKDDLYHKLDNQAEFKEKHSDLFKEKSPLHGANPPAKASTGMGAGK